MHLTENWIYTAPIVVKPLRRSGMDDTNACLYLVSIHQMAPPQTAVANI